jgi:hypothetical protein
MARPIIDARFYDTYQFVSGVHEILTDTSAHLLLINEFCCDGQHLAHSAAFPRYSALHCFLEFLIRGWLIDESLHVDLAERKAMLADSKGFDEPLDDWDPCVLPVEEAMKHYGFELEPFTDWLKHQGKRFEAADENDISEYLDELPLTEPFDKLLTQSVREAFYILFGNRRLLLHFNDMMAQELTLHAKDEIPEEYAAKFSKPGILKRVGIPEWAKRAVFFRDRGLCVTCGNDLSGLMSAWPDEHYDHVVPLTAGGLNDVTNLQVLCGTCNRKKGPRHIVTSNSYEDWYPFKRRDE